MGGPPHALSASGKALGEAAMVTVGIWVLRTTSWKSCLQSVIRTGPKAEVRERRCWASWPPASQSLEDWTKSRAGEAEEFCSIPIWALSI